MENTVAQKLEALKKLQAIDSQLVEIKKIRGDLPEEVEDLEDEIAGYNTRITKFEEELTAYKETIKEHKASIKEYQERIAYLEDQQMNVRNNREYDAINKELEMLGLDTQVSEKRIREAKIAIEAKEEQIGMTKQMLDERQKDLDAKQVELKEILSETEVEEEKLLKQREKASKNIEERLLNAYNKIRINSSNGLAVVPVRRGACGGCFNAVPPQKQADIKEKRKIIVCEHCGRLMSDVEIVIEEEKKKTTRKRSVRRKKAE
ncbi:zinc ribbon domain-containing protein [Algivirga pacifica]|uniref:C4-type zinc ribbon domain-containing protein n=1 Tax=Algivirga pacifica TaxID=1162670 RepID=A0ABP9DE36_9BACT